MTPGRHRNRGLAVACVVAIAGGCGAPSARRVGGEVAKAVEAALASGRESFDQKAWGALLAGGTKDGLVDYRFMQDHRADLETYLNNVGSTHLDRLSPDDLEATLINSYNAYTVLSILDHPDVTSIKEIPGVWTSVRHRVGGFDLTLDEIEHRLLRPYFRDPRVHFALNCASRSCAPLPPWAYEGGRIDAQLEERARSFLSDPKNVRLEGSRLLVSKYFDWYGGDFTGSGWKGSAWSIAAYLKRHAVPAIGAFIDGRSGRPPIEFLDYDWSLNAAVPPDRSVRPVERGARGKPAADAPSPASAG